MTLCSSYVSSSALPHAFGDAYDLLQDDTGASDMETINGPPGFIAITDYNRIVSMRATGKVC